MPHYHESTRLDRLCLVISCDACLYLPRYTHAVQKIVLLASQSVKQRLPISVKIMVKIGYRRIRKEMCSVIEEEIQLRLFDGCD